MGNSVHMAKGQKQSFFTKRNTRKNDESFEKSRKPPDMECVLIRDAYFSG